MKPRLRALVSIALLALVLWRLDLGRTLELLRSLEFGWMVLTLAVIVAGVFWSAWKWRILAAALGVGCSYLHLVRWYFIGSFFNHFLPTTVGGDAVRVTLLSRSSGQIPASICSVLAERLTGIIALVGIAAAGAWLVPVPAELRFLTLTYLILLLALLAGGAWLLRGRHTPAKLEKPAGWKAKARYYAGLYAGQIASYRNHRPTLAAALLLSIGFQLLAITVGYLVGRTLEIPVAWSTCLLCIPLATLAALLPVSINGIGVRETAYVALFTRSGLSSEQAFLIGFGTFVFVLLTSLVGGTLALWSEKEQPGGAPAEKG